MSDFNRCTLCMYSKGNSLPVVFNNSGHSIVITLCSSCIKYYGEYVVSSDPDFVQSFRIINE